MMADSKHDIILRQPAIRWHEALPSGNGTVGAMVYGSIRRELILLNHEAIFRRWPRPEIPDVSEHVPEWRRMLAEGRYREAAKFLYRKMEEKGFKARGAGPFEPAFDMGIEMETTHPFRVYRRSLDFETGEVTVRWTEGKTNYQRRLFVSRADDVVVMTITADQPGSVTCGVRLFPHALGRIGGILSGKVVEMPEAQLTFERSAEDGWLEIRGRFEIGDEFGGLARVVAKGGTVETSEETVRVTGADEVIVILKLFANENSGKALERIRTEIAAIGPDYSKLLNRHVPLHRKLFDRVKLDLHGGEKRRLSTEELLMEAYDGDAPTAVIEKLFDYGRYLLISSSRPGGLPANLQGVWNGDYFPPWDCNYTNDWNIQMNYWQALPGNMPEVTLPYFDYYESWVADYQLNARQIYGCGGILASLAQTTHGLMFAGAGYRWTGTWLAWTAAAGWLAQLFYDYWLYTGDREFLAKRAVPFMKEVALFYEDFLLEDARGKLMFSPSLSPENIPANLMSKGADPAIVTINATMDVAIAKEIFTNLSAACEELGVEKDGIRRWRAMLAKLPDYEVNEDGAIREWMWPGLLDNYRHRHMTHLYPLFPGLEVMPESDPALCEAIRVALEKRLVARDFLCPESYVHGANVFARLGKGDRALDCLELAVRAGVRPNLLTSCYDWRWQGLTMGVQHDGPEPPFQIDANFGFAAAVLEMLVYSKPGIVKLLPALPKRWANGKVEGILCRGGIRVSIEWDMAEGRVRAALLSRSEQAVTIKLPGVVKSLECEPANTEISESEYGPAYRKLALRGGKSVGIIARL